MTNQDAIPTRYPVVLGTELKLNMAQVVSEAFSRRLVQLYFAERQFNEDETPEHSAAFFGIARYQALLEEGRRELRDKLSEGELLELLDVFGNQVFDPASLEVLADDYCHGAQDDLTGEPVESRALTKTLRGLSVVGRCALGDAIERIWHVEFPRHRDRSVREFAQAVGIGLRQ